MNENATMQQANSVMDIDDELRRQEELINTIKMEPILLTTQIEEEESLVQKKKKIRFTDYCLMSMIVVLSAVFIMVIFNVM